ncbi:MAG TPA: hypothetical protein VEQ63_11565, partial [Bryobacteraceae bacterium]|nr:hypothetical protein [Bryobacteraceae bacterium]
SSAGSGSISVTVQAGGLEAGTYNGTVILTNTVAGAQMQVPVSLTLAQTVANQIPTNGVVNGASFQGGGVAPGEVIAIYGTRIGPSVLTSGRVTSGILDTLVAETRVVFDGVAAPLIYVSENQIGAIVPYSVAGKSSTEMQVEYRGTRSNTVQLSVTEASPAFFTASANGRGQGGFLNEDLSYNNPANPTEKGKIVVLYATGEGQTNPAGVDGKIATEPYPAPRLPVTVRVGGEDADILYAGAVAGEVAGLLQINARIPMSAPSGAEVPITLTVGGATSPPGVTIAIR